MEKQYESKTKTKKKQKKNQQQKQQETIQYKKNKKTKQYKNKTTTQQQKQMLSKKHPKKSLKKQMPKKKNSSFVAPSCSYAHILPVAWVFIVWLCSCSKYTPISIFPHFPQTAHTHTHTQIIFKNVQTYKHIHAQLQHNKKYPSC